MSKPSSLWVLSQLLASLEFPSKSGSDKGKAEKKKGQLQSRSTLNFFTQSSPFHQFDQLFFVALQM